MMVNYRRSNILTVTNKAGDTFLFVPGNNEITTALWKSFLELPTFKRRLDEGLFRTVSGDDKPSVVVLQELSPSEAKELVNETFDPKMLREFKKSETRPGVLKVIEARLREAEERLSRKDQKDPKDSK
jgi:hypothetical protein